MIPGSPTYKAFLDEIKQDALPSTVLKGLDPQSLWPIDVNFIDFSLYLFARIRALETYIQKSEITFEGSEAIEFWIARKPFSSESDVKGPLNRHIAFTYKSPDCHHVVTATSKVLAAEEMYKALELLYDMTAELSIPDHLYARVTNAAATLSKARGEL